jgi:hypothetical protein
MMKESLEQSSLLNRFDTFFHSPYYVILITTIGMLGLYFHQEVLTIFILALIMSFSWLTTKDILPSFLLISTIALIALRIPRTAGREGLVDIRLLYTTPFFVVPSFIIKMIIHPFKFKRGFFFYPTLAVAIAVTIGGIFVMPIEAYIEMRTLYHMFFLGIGMVFIYFVLERYLTTYKGIGDYFSWMMVGLGIMGVFMLGIAYYEKYYDIAMFNSRTQMQWGNNLANNLLLTMPFAFYLATKTKYTAFFTFVGLIQLLALLFSTSRGGVIFGLMMIPLVLVATLYISKNQRLKLLTFIVLFGGIFYFAILTFVGSFTPLYEEIRDLITVSSTEARAELYKLALRNFLKYPMFGAGIGFDTSPYYAPATMSMYWYHSTFFQIIGSLGLVGVAAYVYQEIMRLYQLVRVRHAFNVFVFLALVGFSAYSMVNVGYFAPLPFVAMVVTMFMVVERHNEVIKQT